MSLAPVSLVQIVVLLVTLERLAELVHGQRNARRLLAAGGTETGAGHYPLFVVLHGAWLATSKRDGGLTPGPVASRHPR